ncbi:hypothetical protein LTR99_006054 [Exophiala xenobiotica]|uniref:DUF1479-domain-containing protein n=1 Tax=Vermiconidia calcicola TaxID=1690605 RepID=A0AAV9QFA7_9PEZI|nr:hypothetical protein LTR92_006057 [Exophiala xenobiotica]KAK5540874.1 hypothetical protein LTR25_002651 [Vermiconidia calcicola]KAK5549635.1 hypothetical protein LTR23_000743 [Chaetothyriales sp. CCFEE 6169]KAK5208258.1 hypothetical protein LTR41_006194 [Exophiala xenobiotica]KAK5236793.1 hypothetical protein LTR47_001971 [Exophiala xenobiotica]
MPGRLLSWPDWPEFTPSKAEPGDDLVGYKKAIVDKYGKDALVQSWLRTCKELESVTDSIAELGSSAIPEIQFQDFFAQTPEQKTKLKDTGCFVVRNVFSEAQADKWFQNLKEYVAANRSSIGEVENFLVNKRCCGTPGWPAETPFILNLYYSPTQIAARSHPNQLRLSEELNSWWHDDTGTTSPEPLSYADGVRIRPPGIPFRGLGPHIDAGSLCRWADPTYQTFYDAVFSGHPELLDNYDLTVRKDANQAMFPGSAHSRVFRSFQGWTALTSAGPGEGSLMLYPNVKWTIAYLLLRPFFRAPDSGELDASKWTFDAQNPWFPGTFRDDSQMLSPSSHPHLRLHECMVGIPKMNPGDTVWWHADMCHAVEVDHNGDHEASVTYIAATPRTEQNKSYIRGQLEDFLKGNPPEDFRRGAGEKQFEGFTGEKSILSGEAGRRAMGFDLLA